MPESLKIALYIIAGVVSAILLFCLIVVIGCSVNGLTFGEQVCVWFGGDLQEYLQNAKEYSDLLNNLQHIQQTG